MHYSNEQIEAAKQGFLDKYNPNRSVEKALEQANGAAVKRARLYTKGLSHTERQPVRERLRRYLSSLQSTYKSGVSVKDHYARIEHLRSHMNQLATDTYFAHDDFSESPGFRIAHAQKSISVFLKHLWCMDRIQPPPECPVDSVILKKVGIYGVPWSAVDTISAHQQLVASIVQKSYATNLAEWELITFGQN